MKVLFAYDGSPCADGALDDAALAGLGDDVEAEVLCVADVWLDTGGPPAVRGFDEALLTNISMAAERARMQALSAVAQCRTVAFHASEQLRRRFPKWQVTEDACAGSPAWEIVRRAEMEPIDLIVVGSHGRGRLGRLLLGSVSQRVAEEAACSVRVARPRGSRVGPPHLLLGVDGSDDARAAVAVVAERCWPAGTSVEVVAALDPVMVSAFGGFVPPLVSWTEEMNASEADALRGIAEQACDVLRARGLSPVPRVLTGKPGRVLLRVARKREVDAIFVGARGLRRIERFFLGSVSAALAARARCSVEIVRPLPRVEPSPRLERASAEVV